MLLKGFQADQVLKYAGLHPDYSTVAYTLTEGIRRDAWLRTPSIRSSTHSNIRSKPVIDHLMLSIDIVNVFFFCNNPSSESDQPSIYVFRFIA